MERISDSCFKHNPDISLHSCPTLFSSADVEELIVMTQKCTLTIEK